MGVTFTIGKATSSRFLDVRFLLTLFAVLVTYVLTPALYAQESVIQLDAAQTKIEFTLGDILHTVHGTFKLKNGTIRFDPSTGKISGSIVVDATSGESGNGSRDRKMHREILESGKFAEIIFMPNQAKGTLARKGPSQMEVLGQFRLHGLDHDVTLPIDIQPDGQQLQLTTHLIVPYVQWGLKNPSTFILRVNDKVTIDIHALARLLSAEAAR